MTTRVLLRTKDTKNWPKAAESLWLLKEHPHALDSTTASPYGLVLFASPILTLSRQVLKVALQSKGCNRHVNRELTW